MFTLIINKQNACDWWIRLVELNTSDMVGRDMTGQTVEVSTVSEAYGTIVGALYSGPLGCNTSDMGQ